jgi:hypothetical protein
MSKKRTASELIVRARKLMKTAGTPPKLTAKQIMELSDLNKRFGFTGFVVSAENKTTRTGKSIVVIGLIDPPTGDDPSAEQISVTIWQNSKHEFSFVIKDLPTSITDMAEGKATEPTIMTIAEAKRNDDTTSIQLWGQRQSISFQTFEDFLK